MRYTLLQLLLIIIFIGLITIILFPHVCGTPKIMILEQQEKILDQPMSKELYKHHHMKISDVDLFKLIQQK
jgi:hypothetical protein